MKVVYLMFCALESHLLTCICFLCFSCFLIFMIFILVKFSCKKKKKKCANNLNYHTTNFVTDLENSWSVNMVISQNSSELLLMKLPQQTKRNVQGYYLGVFMTSLENIFDVCDGVWFSLIFKSFYNSNEGVCDTVCF